MIYKSEKINYYTNGDSIDSNKIYLYLTILDHKEKFRTKVRFLLNTGYSGVLVNANKIGIKLTEQEFRKKYKISPINKNGVSMYRYTVNEIKLGRFTLLNFPIYVTFNPNVTLPLLGTSLLKLFDINIKSSMQYIKFTETRQYHLYTSGKKQCWGIDEAFCDSYISVTNGDMKINTPHNGFFDIILKSIGF